MRNAFTFERNSVTDTLHNIDPHVSAVVDYVTTSPGPSSRGVPAEWGSLSVRLGSCKLDINNGGQHREVQMFCYLHLYPSYISSLDVLLPPPFPVIYIQFTCSVTSTLPHYLCPVYMFCYLPLPPLFLSSSHVLYFLPFPVIDVQFTCSVLAGPSLSVSYVAIHTQ